MTTLLDSGTAYRVTFARTVRSEWTKLRSLRSTWIILGSAVVFVVGLAGLVGWNADRQRDRAPTVTEAVGGGFLGVDLFSLVIGVLGVLLMTGEYSSGLARATLTAVPRRLPVLWAKALVLVAAAAPVMLVVCLVSLPVNQAFVDAGDRVTLGDPEVLRATFGAAAAPVGLGLLGLGMGAMLRHTAGTITAYVATILVVPVLLPVALPTSVEEAVLPYYPTVAAVAMYDVGGNTPYDLLSAGAGALVTAGWVVLVLAGGAAVLHCRDA